MLFKLKKKTQNFFFLSFFFKGRSLVKPLHTSPEQVSTEPTGPPSTGRPSNARLRREEPLPLLLALPPPHFPLQAPPRTGAPAHGRTRGCRGARAAMAAGGGGVADPFSPAGVPCAFSPQSQAYFALASTDGHLRVWETASNRLHQEYVPSAHLSGTCTCLAWAPARLQAKVKRAGWRGAGGRSASASAFRGLAARDPSSRVALRGPGRGGTERGGGARWAHTVSPVRGLS